MREEGRAEEKITQYMRKQYTSTQVREEKIIADDINESKRRRVQMRGW